MQILGLAYPKDLLTPIVDLSRFHIVHFAAKLHFLYTTPKGTTVDLLARIRFGLLNI